MNTEIVAQPTAYSYAARTPLQAAEATITTAQDTYYVSGMCFSGPNSPTAKHSVVVTRLSDGAVAPAVNTLIVKSKGYASVTGIGRWDSYKEAMQALLEHGVRHFEPGMIALTNPVTGPAFVRLEAVGA
jgi:hypothetical protein